MIDFLSIRVGPFSKNEYTPTDRSGPPLFTWKEYYRFRNDLVRVLERYGTVGPIGEMQILDDWERSRDGWQGDTANPDFFVAADMWNEYDRWNRVEASPWLISSTVLQELIAMVRVWPGWCVNIALTEGGLTVLGDRILHEGNLFVGVSSVEDLGQRCTMSKTIKTSGPI